MTSVLMLLDEVPSSPDVDSAGDWFVEIDRSLRRDPDDWQSSIDRIGSLSDEHAWSLLSWIEVAASQIVRTRSRLELVTTAFAMALVLQSALDRRDCAIVASLLRRASELGGLDFMASIAEGCALAGPLGQPAREFLAQASARLPSTYTEAGEGSTFTFARQGPGFDVADLERWLEGDGP
jgi:hypothetical protein